MMASAAIVSAQLPPARASRIAAVLLNRHSAHEIGEAIDVLLDVLALLDPPAEDEPDFRAVSDGMPGCPLDAEPDCDGKGDQAWIEWHTMRGPQKKGHNLTAGHEDDEDSDPAEEDDPSGQCDEDGINTQGQGLQVGRHSGPGCELSDAGEPQHDAEVEQMIGDVPAPAVFSLDHDPFTDRRTHIADPGPGGSVYFRAKGKLWQGTPLGKGPIGLAPTAST